MAAVSCSILFPGWSHNESPAVLMAIRGFTTLWIGVHGGLRGGELALLVASPFSEVKATVSVCGSWPLQTIDSADGSVRRTLAFEVGPFL